MHPTLRVDMPRSGESVLRNIAQRTMDLGLGVDLVGRCNWNLARRSLRFVERTYFVRDEDS